MIQVSSRVINESTIFRWNAGLTPLLASGSMSLLLEDRQLVVSDLLLQHLIRLLQSPQSLASLVRQSHPHDSASVRAAIEELYTEKILAIAHSHTISRNSAAFWDMVPCSGPRLTVAITSLLPNFVAPLEAMLSANGVSLANDADLTVLITDDYLRPEIADMAVTRRRALLAKPIGNEIWIGPCLWGETPLCWHCLAYWLRLRRWPERAALGVEPHEPAPSSSVAWLPSTLTLATGLIGTAASLLAAECGAALAANLWAFDVHTFEGRAYPVARLRNCPACRPEGAADFLDALRSPKTGILDKPRMSSGRVGFVHLINSFVLLPLPHPGVRDPLPPLSADGKGITVEDALHRCTMEAVERYSSVFVGDELLIRGRLAEVSGISADELVLFSEAQLQDRESWNPRPGSLQGIPERFDPYQPTSWVKAKRLLDLEERFIPAGNAYLWYPFRGEPFYNYADTNGCAAGETYEEATLRGLLELVERDALAIWWYNRIRRPRVDLSVWDEEDVQATRRLFAEHGRSVELLDLTHDLQIPAFAAVSADDRGRNIFFGCAADVCPENAAKRALAELIQFWYWGTFSGTSVDRQQWLERSSLDRHAYLVPAGGVAIPETRRMGTREALAVCSAALERGGIEAYVIDLTRPELAIPVVRVVAPGLRHYGPRFAPGRLYEVPASLGWTQAPLREDQLNPEACVL